MDNDKKEINYLFTPLLMLKCVGFWPPNKEEYGRFAVMAYNFYYVFIIVCFITTWTVTEDLYLFEQILIGSGIDKITNGLTHTMSHSLGMYKNIHFALKRKQIRKMIKFLENDERIKYENFEDFRPDDHVRKSIRMTTISTCSLTLTAGTMMLFGATVPIVMSAETVLEADNKTWWTTRPLPFNTWYPYDTRKIPQYYFFYCYQIISLMLTASAIIGIDNLFFGMISQSTAQFQILIMALKTFKSRSVAIVESRMNIQQRRQRGCEESLIGIKDLNSILNLKIEAEMRKQLKKCIIHHTVLLEFCVELQDVFQGMVLGQFSCALVIICVTLFQCATRSGFTLDFVYMGQYLVTQSFELFLFCWFGNELTLESHKLSQAIFDSEWLGCPSDMTRSLLVVQARGIRPFTITALGIFPLNLEMFTRIINGAYSYFAVLNQINEK